MLSGLTDAQALDIANTILKNLESLRWFSEEELKEIVGRIVDYVKKGDTAEEAVEKAKRESEEFVKKLEEEILVFYHSISDVQLANEVLSLINCVKDNLGADGAKWLLDVLKRVYSEAFRESKGNREVANARLRNAVEKVFKYPESITQNCALASAIVSRLKAMEDENAWEELNRIVNYPDGLVVKCRLSLHEKGKEVEYLRIRIPKEKLSPYLGDESCWVKLEVKGRIFYKEYKGEALDYDLPREIGQDGEEVEVTIIKVNTYEFIKTAIREAKTPFDIVLKAGRYKLVVEGKEVCKLFLKEDLHYDSGDWGPAIVLAIRDYEGKEHLIKLVYKESKYYLSKIKATEYQYREIKSMTYKDKWSKLEMEYFLGVGEETRPYEIFFENPKSVLVRKAEELRELVSRGQTDPDLIGEIGERYMTFYNKDEMIKDKASEILGAPKDKLEVRRTTTLKWGPDFYVYYEGKLVTIVEVKTTTSEKYVKYRLDNATVQLTNYFTNEKWKDEYFGKAKYGIPIVILLEDLDKIIETNFSEGIKIIFGKEIINPNYEG